MNTKIKKVSTSYSEGFEEGYRKGFNLGMASLKSKELEEHLETFIEGLIVHVGKKSFCKCNSEEGCCGCGETHIEVTSTTATPC